ncbi:hypothetical protein [Virgisporangium aurantiacum]|uniref:Uncharacterized protein n=1 Tax=Virgisporangium aurantiacum TaxID=175570 RepID=A0A8J3Z929_9ACTN|nr:hypothetical protein [Virgisporangium aurantiacum]GIJ57510.1 hypothetical protein Vau01_050260 [Virgisporangium aurantiacum]
MFQNLRRRVLAVAVAAGLAAGALTAGEAAQGAPMPLSVETAASAFDLSPSKEVLVTCPGDAEVLGGGADVIGGARRVHIVRSQPSPSQTGWLVGAQAIPGGKAGAWQLHAYVVCAYHVNIDLGFIGDTRVVSMRSPTDSESAKSVTATCAAGDLVVSAGGRVVTGNGEVVLDDVVLDTATQSVRSRAVEREGGTAADWSVWAFAVCAAPGSLFGYELVEQDSDNTAGDRTVDVECPGTKRRIGLGASMTGAGGHAGYTSLFPADDSVTVESTVDPTGAPGPFTTRAQAVCAFPYSSGE